MEKPKEDLLLFQCKCKNDLTTYTFSYTPNIKDGPRVPPQEGVIPIVGKYIENSKTKDLFFVVDDPKEEEKLAKTLSCKDDLKNFRCDILHRSLNKSKGGRDISFKFRNLYKNHDALFFYTLLADPNSTEKDLDRMDCFFDAVKVSTENYKELLRDRINNSRLSCFIRNYTHQAGIQAAQSAIFHDFFQKTGKILGWGEKANVRYKIIEDTTTYTSMEVHIAVEIIKINDPYAPKQKGGEKANKGKEGDIHISYKIHAEQENGNAMNSLTCKEEIPYRYSDLKIELNFQSPDYEKLKSSILDKIREVAIDDPTENFNKDSFIPL